ncbi:MAG TPA: ParA family protein [Caproicibacter sp.]|nr:ParA family protein [Caproicibacter sp.]
MASKVIAVWGSLGSGKTLTTVKIAKTLSEKKKNIVIVGCDVVSPVIPLLLPTESKTASIGELLALPNMTEMAVLQHCVPYSNNDYIGILGYGAGENIRTYPEYSLQRGKELIKILRHVADYMLFDCTSHITDDPLTAAALEEADITFKVVNPDLKSISYIRSQKSLLQNSHFHYSDQVNIVNNILPTQDTSPISEYLENKVYMLPSVPALKEQFDSGQLLDTVFGKNAKDYVMSLKALVKETIDNDA